MSNARFHARFVASAALSAALFSPLAAAAQTPGDDLCPEPGDQWIGVSSDLEACADEAGDCCPVPDAFAGTWQASRLFQLPGRTAPLPPGLAPYCVYRATPEGTSSLDALQEELGGVITGWVRDTAIVISLSEDAWSGSALPIQPRRQKLRASFSSLGRGGLLPLPTGVDQRARVEIAVLDTSPIDVSGQIPLGQVPHGHVVGWTARDLICDEPLSGDCFGHVSTYLAMPWVTETQADCAQGGAFGKRSDLARRVFQAVETWKEHAAARPRLAIPLALGWEPSRGGADDVASRAVHAALVHASCHGAFLAAAAGNDAGGTKPPLGPMLPAAWESELAPTRDACANFEGVASVDALVPKSRFPLHLPAADALDAPLLLSIGGVDREDRPIALTRPRSLTRLVALAFQADAGGADELPPPHTGTSIGATVAGAAAAAVWAYAPEKTAAEVMDILSRTAVPVWGIPESLCEDVDRCARRISLCDAIAWACEPAGQATSPRCPADGIKCRTRPQEWEALRDREIMEWQEANGHASVPLTAVEVSYHQRRPAITAAPIVLPQPSVSVCHRCGYSPFGLYADLGLVDTVTLTLFTSAANGSSGVASYAFDNPGHAFTVGPLEAQGVVRAAMISWMTPNGTSAAEQIPVTH